MQKTDAPSILKSAAECIGNRANERDDTKKGERSMAAAVAAFNALYGTNLTEVQGWMFMALLKAARARQGDLNLDDYVDGAAYFALAGEAAAQPNAPGQYVFKSLNLGISNDLPVKLAP
jgi:hypothetical protein